MHVHTSSIHSFNSCMKRDIIMLNDLTSLKFYNINKPYNYCLVECS